MKAGFDGMGLRPLLLASGVTDDELRHLRATDAVTAIRPGAYLPSTDDRLHDALARHEMLIHSTMKKVSPDSVVSHTSAAVLHGLALWQVPLGRVHTTKDRRSGGHVSTHVHAHVALLDEGDVVEMDGLLVTSIARTLADLARGLSFEQALVPIDWAMHRHLVTRADLEAAVDRRHGAPRARRVVDFAAAGAMSPGETRSRLAIHRAGLPRPVLQHRFPGMTTEVDFWWPETRTIGEFDGFTKYGRLLVPGQVPADVVFAEKVREDRLRDVSAGFVRWTWDELPPAFAPVAMRIRQAFARA
jgi:hypothetical protein